MTIGIHIMFHFPDPPAFEGEIRSRRGAPQRNLTPSDCASGQSSDWPPQSAGTHRLAVLRAQLCRYSLVPSAPAPPCRHGRCPRRATSRRTSATSARPPRPFGRSRGGPWSTTFAPILSSFSRRLVSDRGSAPLGIARVRMKLPRDDCSFVNQVHTSSSYYGSIAEWR